MFRPRTLISAVLHEAHPGVPARLHSSLLHVLVAALVAVVLALAGLVCAPRPAYGAELRQGDAVIVLPGESIDDDLYALGQTISIQGTVNGDVVAVGESVSIGGTVTGSVLVMGNRVQITGPVGGTARLGGQTVEISAPVAHDGLVVGTTVSVGPQAAVGRELVIGGKTVTVGGPVGRSLRADADSLTVGGPVGGDVLARVGSLRLTSGAKVEGSLAYTSSHEAAMEPGATIHGLTTRHEVDSAGSEASDWARLGWGALAWLKGLIGIAIFGLVLLWLLPGLVQRAAATLTGAPWTSLGLGVALLVGVPIVALMLFVVGLIVGGWWIGPLALAAFLVVLPSGYAIGGLVAGRFVTERVGPSSAALGWRLVAGLALLGLVSLLPVVGVVAVLVTVAFGLGAFALALVAAYRGRSTPATMAVTSMLTPPNGAQKDALEVTSRRIP